MVRRYNLWQESVDLVPDLRLLTDGGTCCALIQLLQYQENKCPNRDDHLLSCQTLLLQFFSPSYFAVCAGLDNFYSLGIKWELGTKIFDLFGHSLNLTVIINITNYISYIGCDQAHLFFFHAPRR